MSFSQYYQVIFVLIGSIKLKIFGTFKVCFLKHFSNHVYDSPLSVDSEIDLFFYQLKLTLSSPSGCPWWTRDIWSYVACTLLCCFILLLPSSIFLMSASVYFLPAYLSHPTPTSHLPTHLPLGPILHSL